MFFIFFCSGAGKGESEAPAGGVQFFIGNPRRVSWAGGGGGGRGAGRVFAGGGEGPGECLREFGWGAKYFFGGLKFPPRLHVGAGLLQGPKHALQANYLPHIWSWSFENSS